MHIEAFVINDLVLEDVAIRDVVAGLCNGIAGGSGGVKAIHIKV